LARRTSTVLLMVSVWPESGFSGLRACRGSQAGPPL